MRHSGRVQVQGKGSMREAIVKTLGRIEEAHNVKIVLASESGSRAWGFPSYDSDWDVRFIYVHPRDWYLSIAEKRDVIELPVDAVLDVNGWDLRKALRLMKKSNSPLMEWLTSPIRYLVWDAAYQILSELSVKAFLPETSCHHYLSMAKKKIGAVYDSRKVRLKTLMYAIRPVLCCEWIIRHGTQPPMQMSELLDSVADDGRFRMKVVGLIEEKAKHPEGHMVDRSDTIERYLLTKIHDIENRIPKNNKKLGTETFDSAFRDILSLPRR